MFYDTLLRLADGSPGIVYHNLTAARVQFRRAPDHFGTTWDDFVKLADTAGNGNLVPRALMVGDIPHAFWYHAPTGSLMHCHATSQSGLTWTEPAAVAGGVDNSVLFSPLNLNGLAAVGYVDLNGNIRFAVRY
jgi:hypothetical protein